MNIFTELTFTAIAFVLLLLGVLLIVVAFLRPRIPKPKQPLIEQLTIANCVFILTSDPGASVSFLARNDDLGPEETDHCVTVCADWTLWIDEPFYGKSISSALHAACLKRSERRANSSVAQE